MTALKFLPAHVFWRIIFQSTTFSTVPMVVDMVYAIALPNLAKPDMDSFYSQWNMQYYASCAVKMHFDKFYLEMGLLLPFSFFLVIWGFEGIESG